MILEIMAADTLYEKFEVTEINFGLESNLRKQKTSVLLSLKRKIQKQFFKEQPLRDTIQYHPFFLIIRSDNNQINSLHFSIDIINHAEERQSKTQLTS